jgi:hypothetical protein
MVINHRFSFDVACPGCHVLGRIKVLEDAGPPFTDIPRRTYVGESEKFSVAAGDPPTVRCVSCGAEFGSQL